MPEKLLTDTEASLHLGITKELLYAYVRNAPKKALHHNRKLGSVEVEGKNRFRLEDLDAFDAYLKEPWSNNGDARPEIPSYVQDYLKTEIGGKCPVTGKGYPLENAHLEDYNISKSHHHHNLIRIAKEEHTKYDSGVLSKELLVQKKMSLIESLRKRMANAPSETSIITYLPNIDIESIKGRQEEINKIHKLIAENGKTIIVNGLGGIGKTSLAQLYCRLYHGEYDYFCWIEFPEVDENATSREVFMSGIANNFLLLEFLGITLDNKISLDDQFQFVLKKIANLSGRKLFVFDNVPVAINEFSFLLPTSPGFNILGTSRVLMEDFANFTIDVLQERDAIELFYSFYNLAINDALVLDILKLIGFHTLAIELISKFATKRNLTLETLYKIISDEGINTSIEAKVTTKHGKNRESKAPFNHLCDIFDVSRLNEGQIFLLRNLSIIGNVRLSFSQLEGILNDQSDSNKLFHTLTELHQLGWVTKLNGQYYTHQLICEVLRFKLKPNVEQCNTLVDNIYSFIEKSSNDFSLYVQRPYIEIAEQITNTISLSEEITSRYKLFIARYYGFSGNYEKYYSWYANAEIEQLDPTIKKFVLANHGNILLSQGYCTEAIDVLEQCKNLFQGGSISVQIEATIAHAYSVLGNFVKANEYFEPAYKILENEPDLDKLEFAIFINNYAQTLNGIGHFNKALELSLKALAIREELLDKNHPLLAQSYNNVGVDYEYQKQLDKALLFHNKALAIRENFGEENVDLGESYHNLASIYFSTLNFSKAKDYFEKAIAIREKVYPDGHPSLVTTYCCFATLMTKIDSSQAVQLYQKAFSFTEKFDFENNQNTSFWLMGFAIALFENGSIQEALKYIELAIAKFKQYNDIERMNYATVFKKKILANSAGLVVKIPGRNESCSCGSGKKYKKCCGIR